MPSDRSSRTGLVLLTGVSLLAWAIAGYAFIQRDDIGAKLAQTEAARATAAADLEHAQAATTAATEAQQKLTAAEAALAQAKAQTADLTQQVSTLTADLAARTHERDVLQAQLTTARANTAAAQSAPAAEPHTAPPPKHTHKNAQ